MIEYNDYEKINKYLDNNALDKLREYVSKEYDKTKLIEAKQAVSKYFDTYRTSIYEYIDGKLLISNSISAYLLNNDELLSDYRKKKLNDPKHKINYDALNAVYDVYSSSFSAKQIEIAKIEETYLSNGTSKVYCISSKCGNITYYFNIDNFNTSKKILGEDAKYTLCSSRCICLAESEKGKGLIAGIKI